MGGGFRSRSNVVSAAAAINIDLVTVGDPGNVADTAADSGNPAGQGAVAYTYQIGKFDVTDNEYAAFLTAKAAGSDPYNLWDSIMQTTADGGIDRTGSGPYTYTVKPGQGNQPVVGVTWFDALRFVNWLDNGQGNGNTETGSYTLLGVSTPTPSNFRTISRNPGTQWVLPSEDEWYKAAYYNEQAARTPATGPIRHAATRPRPRRALRRNNSANFYNATTGYALTQSTSLVSTFDYLTDVGAYMVRLAPTGRSTRVATFGSGTRRTSWETVPRGHARWSFATTYELNSPARNDGYAPANEDYHVGFRVAYVPEPGSLTLLAAGAIASIVYWRRWKLATK